MNNRDDLFPEAPERCPDCNAPLDEFDTLIDHRLMWPRTCAEDVRVGTWREQFWCEDCGTHFESDDEVQEHQDQHPVECSVLQRIEGWE